MSPIPKLISWEGCGVVTEDGMGGSASPSLSWEGLARSWSELRGVQFTVLRGKGAPRSGSLEALSQPMIRASTAFHNPRLIAFHQFRHGAAFSSKESKFLPGAERQHFHF